MDLCVQRQVYLVAAGAQLAFHPGAVCRGVFQIVHLEQDLDRVAHGVLQVVHIGVERPGFRVLPQDSGRLRVLRFGEFLQGNHLVFIHHAQNIVGAVVDAGNVVDAFSGTGVEVPTGIVVVGVGGHPGQHGTLPEGQLLELFAEVAFGCHLDSIVVLPQVDGVEVTLQDFVLGVACLQLKRQVGLLYFALIALLEGEQGILDQLLGDGGTALLGAGNEVGGKGADDAFEIDPAVAIKPHILRRYKGISQVMGHGIDAHHDAVFSALVVGDKVSVAVIEEGGLVLVADFGDIQHRRCLHIRFGNADHRANARKACQEHHQKKHLEGVDDDRQHEAGLARAALEQPVAGIVLPVYQRPFAFEGPVVKEPVDGPSSCAQVCGNYITKRNVRPIAAKKPVTIDKTAPECLTLPARCCKMSVIIWVPAKARKARWKEGWAE